MKKNIMIITISAIGISVMVIALLFFYSGGSGEENDTEAPEIYVVSETDDFLDIQNQTNQEELWDVAMANFQSYGDTYSTLGNIQGSVSRFGRSFEFEIQFESLIDGENADIRVFSGQEELYLKSFNSIIYLSESNTSQNWYQLDSSEAQNSTEQNVSLQNLTNLAQLGSNLANPEKTYLGSQQCGEHICHVYEVELNDQPAEIVINEASQSIQEIAINRNERNSSISFANSDQVVTEPQNITVLNSQESKEKGQAAMSEIVKNSIFS